jgi:hypothetical protein
MGGSGTALVLLTAALAVAQAGARAADAVPVLAGIDPPGLTLGATVDATLTGSGLARVERFLVSGTGLEVATVGAATETTIRVRGHAHVDAQPGFRTLRAVGPSGISNLILLRLDTLPQSREAEPNDDPAAANPLAVPSAVAGVLRPQDLDLFAFPGQAGQRITLEVEARRLGAAVVPVARLLAPSGTSLARSGMLRDGSGDCRLTVVLPAAGRYVVEVRDALYGGGDTACYRLRIDTDTEESRAPPGGSVSGPRANSGRLAFGATTEGRIDRPGAVDRYEVAVKSGEKVCVAVEAAALGSWLDPVVTLDDSQGNRIAENDDRGSRTRDSRLEAEARGDGVVVVTVSDRFHEGGSEYTYRLTVGPPRLDFTLLLRLGPGPGPLASGALNLVPASRTALRFQVLAEGRPGPISVRAEGLPQGVVARPVVVGIDRTVPSGEAMGEGTLILEVEPDARPAIGSLRVVAAARAVGGTTLTRQGTATLVLSSVPPGDPRPPPTRLVTELPVMIVGPAR